jgi:hypothetical protein
MRPLESLERLRAHVEQTAQELQRLREENHSLARRLEELQTLTPDAGTGTALVFEEAPDDLRQKIRGLIETIDTYLANETEDVP